jgi:hypothetical protein
MTETTFTFQKSKAVIISLGLCDQIIDGMFIEINRSLPFCLTVLGNFAISFDSCSTRYKSRKRESFQVATVPLCSEPKVPKKATAFVVWMTW